MYDEILFGDCFELIKKIPSKSIDLIITDPPYNISRDSNFSKGSNNKKYNSISLQFGEWDLESINLDLLFSEFHRVLKNGSTVILFYDIWKSNEVKFYFEKYKFKQLRVCCWTKTNPVPINSKINYLSNATEYFFVFVKGTKRVFKSEYDNGIYKYPLCHGKERLAHPTQKPLKLFIDLILKHSNEQDVILDPFGGVGTTAEACIKTERKFILIENDLDYFELANSRIKQSTLN